MSAEQKELIDHELRQPATEQSLLDNKTPEQLAKLVIHHALDARRLLGAIEAANLYLDSGQPGHAHRVIRDAVDFYGLLLAMRAKELRS